MFRTQIGIDLGTANVLVYVKGKGVVLNEPSVVAVDEAENRVMAVGEQARAMLGRTPGSVTVTRPLRSGVIADYNVTLAMLRYFISKVRGWLHILNPQVMICVPAGVTSVESRAVRDAALQAGASRAYLIQEPLAAALGARIPIHLPSGNMIVDIGGGTTEAAVISLNGIVVWNSTRVGGDRLDEAITNYIKRKYSLMIGDRSAEDVKIAIGSAMALEGELTCEVRGRDQVGGLPKTITVRSSEIREALAEPLSSIVGAVRSVLEQTPPELASDVIDKGIIVSGGGALLRLIDRLLTQETGVPCYVAEKPLECVAVGAGLALDRFELLRRNLPTVEN